MESHAVSLGEYNLYVLSTFRYEPTVFKVKARTAEFPCRNKKL